MGTEWIKTIIRIKRFQMTLTASERLYTALSGLLPDRVPTLPKIWVDLGAALTGTDLREVIENPETAMEVIVQGALEVKADAARLFHFPARKTAVLDEDLVELDQDGNVLGKIDVLGGLATQLTDPDKIRLEDPYQMAFVQFWNTPEPIVHTIEDARRIAVPEKSLYQQLGFENLQNKLQSEYSEKIAMIGDCASATLAFCVLYRKLENALMDFIVNPGLVHALMEKGVAVAIEKGKFNIDSGLKMLRLNDSVANMSVISPEHFREFIFPHMKTLCDELHRYDPDVRIYCHICGDVMPIMDDLVETGLDCIGPLDPLGGSTAAQARQAVGDRVALMGGVNTLSFINSTPGQIIEESRICIETSGKKGFILGSGCVIPRSARKENIIALHTASERFGSIEIKN